MPPPLREQILTTRPPPLSALLLIAWRAGFRQNILEKLKNKQQLANEFLTDFESRLSARKLLENY